MISIQEVAIQEWGAPIIRFAEHVAARYDEIMEPKELGTSAEEWVGWHFLFPRVRLSVWIHVRVLEHCARIYVVPEGKLAIWHGAPRWRDQHIGDVKKPEALEDLIPIILARFPQPPSKAAPQ